MKQKYYKYPVITLFVILAIKLLGLIISYYSIISIRGHVPPTSKTEEVSVFNLFTISQLALLLIFIIIYIKLRKIYVHVKYVKFQVACCLIAYIIIPLLSFLGIFFLRSFYNKEAYLTAVGFISTFSSYLFAIFLFMSILLMVAIVKTSFAYIEQITPEDEGNYLDGIAV